MTWPQSTDLFPLPNLQQIGCEEALQPNSGRAVPCAMEVWRRHRSILHRGTSLTSSPHLGVLLCKSGKQYQRLGWPLAKVQVPRQQCCDIDAGRDQSLFHEPTRRGLHHYHAKRLCARNPVRDDADGAGRCCYCQMRQAGSCLQSGFQSQGTQPLVHSTHSFLRWWRQHSDFGRLLILIYVFCIIRRASSQDRITDWQERSSANRQMKPCMKFPESGRTKSSLRR